MLRLEWRLTLISVLILPVFVIVAKRVRAPSPARAMELNASMNATMTERFNVSGAMLLKEFGSPDREAREFCGRAGRVPGHLRAAGHHPAD